MFRSCAAVALTTLAVVALLPHHAEACSQVEDPIALYPANGTTEVPTDSLLWFSGMYTVEGLELTLSEADDASSTLAFDYVDVAMEAHQTHAIRPVEALKPNTAYTIKTRNTNGLNTDVIWTFTTGAGAGSGQAPQMTDLRYFHASHPGAEVDLGCGLMAEATAAFAASASTTAPVWHYRVEMETASGAVVERAWRSWAGSDEEFAAFALLEGADPVCATVTAIDAFGQVSEPISTCAPDRCLALEPAADFLEYYTADGWNDVMSCNLNPEDGSVVGEGAESSDEGCSTLGSHGAPANPAPGFVLVALGLGVMVRRRIATC